MSHPRFHFEKRKSLADFLFENIPNQFLYHCLKTSTSFPDETFYKDGKPCGVWNFWDEDGELENTENHEE
jgi:hypothetical protein